MFFTAVNCSLNCLAMSVTPVVMVESAGLVAFTIKNKNNYNLTASQSERRRFQMLFDITTNRVLRVWIIQERTSSCDLLSKDVDSF